MEILPELKKYLIQKQWKFKPADGGNINVQTCPFCGRAKWKFVIHAVKTVYRCWNCDARGNLYKLKRELGDLQGGGGGVVSATKLVGGEDEDQRQGGSGKTVSMAIVDKLHAKLLKDSRAMDYLTTDRGLTLKTIKAFKLGLRTKNGKWLAIPHIVNGVCANIKFRSLPPADKTFRRMSGHASVLFNQDVLADCDEVVLVEAETDCMSFIQAGVPNVIGLTCGADTFLSEWFDLLADKEKITIVMDADAVGQKGARDIARRLGFDRCWNVMLPSHDANAVLTELGPDELAQSLEHAEQFEVGGIITAADALSRCKDTAEIGDIGLLTPWRDVNHLLGPGWQPGDLVVVSAKVKTGKTTWTLEECLFLASMGVPVLFYCLEMRTERLAQKIAAHLRKKAVEDLTTVDYSYARYMVRRMPFYFVEPDWGGSLKMESVFDKVREAVKRYGVRLMVFDHLHFLCRSLQYITTEIGQVTRGFKLMCEELGLVTLLIAQPKKIQGDRVMKMDDIKDSSAIPADADQVILLHRKARPAGFDGDVQSAEDAEVLEPKTLVRIDAARFRGGGECILYYQGETATFFDWQDRPIKEL